MEKSIIKCARNETSTLMWAKVIINIQYIVIIHTRGCLFAPKVAKKNSILLLTCGLTHFSFKKNLFVCCES